MASSDTHEVKLVARDTGFTNTFTRAGTSVKGLERNLDEAEKQVQETNRDMSQFGRTVGTALGAIAVASVKMAGEQQRLNIAIQRAYGDSADEINRFADELQRTTTYSNDAAQQAALTASTLTRNYGLTTEQVEQLIRVSADLAAVNGMDLSEAVERTSSAIRGEAESAEMLGLTMNDTAIHIEKLGPAASDAEKAQYRLNALLEQSSFAAGTAAEMADQNSQAWKRWANQGQDLLQSLGANLADYQGLILTVSASAAALGPVGDAFEAIGGRARVASLGSKLLASSWAGPAGIAVGAIAVGAAIVALIHDTDNLAESQARAKQLSDELGASLGDLAERFREVGVLTEAQQAYAYFEAISQGAVEAEDNVQTFNTEFEQFKQDSVATGQAVATVQNGLVRLSDEYGNLGQVLSQRTSDVLQYIGALDDGIVTTEEMAAAQAFLSGNFEASADTLAEYQGAFVAAMSLAADPRYNGAEIIKNVQAINAAVEAGQLTEEQGVDLLKAIVSQRDHYNLILNESTTATRANTSAVTANNIAIDQGGETIANDTIIREANRRAQAATIKQFGEENRAIQTHTDVTLEDVQAQRDHAATIAEMVSAYADVDPNAAAAAVGITSVGNAASINTEQLAANEEALASLNDALNTTAVDGLNNAYGMVVGFTDGIVKSITKVQEWSDSLMAPLGTDFMENGDPSAMLKLYQDGKIDIEDYNEALAAQTSIYDDVGRATEAANIIQIKQANILAENADAAADYIVGISKMDERQQQIALGYADTNEALKVNQTLTTAASVAAGEFSDKQTEAWEKSVLAAAQTDSTYAAMLFDLGILKGNIGDPSSWQIDASVAAGGKSEIDNLATAIYDLITALASAYDLDINTNDNGALKRAGLYAEMAALRAGDQDADVDIGADTTDFWSGVSGINGTTVGTAYINISPRIQPIPGLATGGLVGAGDHANTEPQAAALGRLSGAQLITANEHGQETFMLPQGTLINPASATSARGRGTSADIADSRPLFSGPVTIVANDPGQLAVKMRPYRRNRSRT